MNHARSRKDGKMLTGKTFTAEVQKDRAAKGLKLTIMIVPKMGLHYFQYTTNGKQGKADNTNKAAIA
ncbi:MAG: hypothetical protein ACRD42_03980 [Nitrososphaeraceae archaeon]